MYTILTILYVKQVKYDQGQHALPFASLITAICLNAGVKERKTDMKLGVGVPITLQLINTFKERAVVPPANREEVDPAE